VTAEPAGNETIGLIDVWLPSALFTYLNENALGALAGEASEVSDEPWAEQEGVRIGAEASVSSCLHPSFLEAFVKHVLRWMQGLAPDSSDRVFFVCGPGGELAWRLRGRPDETAVRDAVRAVLGEEIDA
jgi:hypothetical protein